MSTETILDVIKKSVENIVFYALLAKNPRAALKDFDLTMEEKAALSYGDMQFIESRTGTKLDGETIKKVIIPLLSRTRHPDDEKTATILWCRQRMPRPDRNNCRDRIPIECLCNE